MTEPTPAELAADAYVAGYPLVVTTRTLQRIGGFIGVNQLLWQRRLAGPEARVIVAPNRDTLYSIAVLDLRSEPMVLSLPDVPDRYHTYQLLDAWTESFAYVGTRTTGGEAGRWAITTPGWDGDVPDGVEVIEAPTPQVFLLGRFLVEDEADVAGVIAISEHASLAPLSACTGTDAPPPPPPLGDAPGAPQALPTDASFFDELVAALEVNPPTTDADRAAFAGLARLGVEAGGPPTGELDAEVRAALDAGAAEGDRRIDGQVRDHGRRSGGWIVNPEVGTYGDRLLLRANVARIGWGANVAEEALYPIARADAEGEPLDGSRTYRIRFGPDGLPPVGAFWSLTAYDHEMYLAPHPSGRWHLGDHAPGFAPAPDGSLEVVVAHHEPAALAEGEMWLPVPEGRFVLMLRLYLPHDDLVEGLYQYPPIERT